MGLIIGLLVLLALCVVLGVIRKLGGGTFFPPPGIDGDHHVRDKEGRWWRYNEQGNVEQVFPRKKKRS